MKSLSIERMESIQGGSTCSTTANVLGTIGWGLGIAAFFVPGGQIVTLALLGSQGAVFGTVGMAMGWMCD